jgi:hypothetical protein
MLHGNAAELLLDLGRWDEAHDHLVAVTPPPAVDHPQINISLWALVLAAERGDDPATARELARLEHLKIEEMDAQFQAPYWASRISDLRWHGALSDAYQLAVTALDAVGHEEAWVQAIELTAQGIEVVADAAEAGVADESWVAAVESWEGRFSAEIMANQRSGGFGLASAANLARAHGKNDPQLWRAAIQVWDERSNDYYGAKARWRAAQAIAERDPTDPEITTLLAVARETAVRLGAKPLLEAVGALQTHFR